jgi:hypothetical protein
MPLFYWLLDAAVVNSYLISKKSSNQQKSHKDFRVDLAWELVNSTDEAGRPSSKPLQEKVNRSRATENITISSKKKDQTVHFQIAGPRGACEWCRINICKLKIQTGIPYRVTSYCEYYNVPLCTVPERDCFRKYHLH